MWWGRVSSRSANSRSVATIARVIEQVRRRPAVVEAVVTVAVLGLSFLLGYAWLAPNPFALWVFVGLVGVARLLTRGRRRRQQAGGTWREYRDYSGGGTTGFEAPLLPRARLWSWLEFVAFAAALTAYYGGVLRSGASVFDELPPALVFWPAVVGLGWFIRERVRPSRLLVTPHGVTIGGRPHAWADIRGVYLDDDSIELEVAGRSWLRRAADTRKIDIDLTGYALSPAEIHWLVQHYLLFPADRARMTALPIRDFALTS